MAKRAITNTIDSDTFSSGKLITRNINGSGDVLHQLLITVTGKITLTASGVTVKRGGIFNLLKNINFRVDGFDPAVTRRESARDRVNVPGRFFGHSPVTALPNDLPRINLLNLSFPLPGGGAANAMSYFQDIDPTKLNEAQDFSFECEIPFYVPRGIQPRDTHLDMKNLNFAKIQIECGDLQDVFTAAGVAGTIDASSIVEFSLNRLHQIDPLQARGSAENPQGYFRYTWQGIDVVADSKAFTQSIPISENIHSITFASFDSTGAARDDIIKRIQIQQNNDAYFDLTADKIRRKNIRDYPEFSMNAITPAGVYSSRSLFSGSGLLIVQPDAFPSGVQLSQSPYSGRADENSRFELEIEKPEVGNGRIEILMTELVPGPLLASETRRVAEQTPAQRQLNAPRRALYEQRAAQIEQQANSNQVS